MSPLSHRDFESSDEKALVRQKWDRPILEALHQESKQPLNYFGLPGPAIEDVLDWRDLLGIVTGVERLRKGAADHEEDLERHRRMHRNVMANDIQQFQLLRGEIEELILQGLDQDGDAPRLHRGSSRNEMSFGYSLVNLDFLGGIGYRVKKGVPATQSKRGRALKKLFERQQGTEFVLLATFNVRDRVGEELLAYIHNTRERVEEALRPTLDWYANRGASEKIYILKAVVPLFVQHSAEENMFACHAYPPVAYGGTGTATLVHFAFRLTPQDGDLQAFSPQYAGDLINLPLVTTAGGVLRVAAQQHPGFDFQKCADSLSFLPEDLRTEIVAHAEQLVAGEEE
jgi:hypothetical protein